MAEETEVQPEEIIEEAPKARFLERLKHHKFKILGGVLGVLVFAGATFCAYKLGQKQVQPTPQPTPTPRIAPSPISGERVEISATDNDSRVTLGVGQTLVLSLESNLTTGYGWEIAEIDEDVLKQTYYEYKPDQPTLIGSGGQDVWNFRAEAEGNTTLLLRYRRPWEEKEPIQTFRVEVVVQPEEGRKDGGGAEKVLCEESRPQVCTMECIVNPPYICGSDGESYCSACQACANSEVEWYVMQDEPCGAE